MSLYPIRPSFAAGVLTPTLHKRTDLNQYYLGLKTGENIIVLPQGGAINRPGFEYIAYAKYPSKKVRLEAFEFSTEQAYVLEFGDKYMRVYKDGGQVVHTVSTTDAWVTSTSYSVGDFVNNNSVVYRCIAAHTSDAATEPGVGASWETYWIADDAYEIVTPWQEDELFDLRFVQSADTLFVFHENYTPRTITRADHTNWTIDGYAWENGPFLPENGTDTTLTITGSNGLVGDSVTVTASSPIFSSTDYGRWIRIRYTRPEREVAHDTPTPGGDMYYGPWTIEGPFRFDIDFREKDGADTLFLQYSYDGGSNWLNFASFVPHSAYNTYVTGELYSKDYNDIPIQMRIYYNDDGVSGGVNMAYVLKETSYEDYGYIRITEYVSDTQVKGVVMQACPYLNKTTRNWALGAWSTTTGWPKTGGFGNGRFWLAATKDSPQTIWGSVTQDYTNHGISIPLVDDDAVSATLDSSKMNAVEHIVTMDKIIVFTSGSVWLISGGNEEVITPSSIMARLQEGRGSSKVAPLVIGNSVLFCTRQGATIRELAYSFEQDAFTSLNRSILSQHLFDGHTITQMTYQQEPWSAVWIVRDDGKLLTFTYLQEHEVFAWTLQEVAGTGAVVESVCSIPGIDEDEVWIAVKRTINGSTVRCIERLHMREWGDNLENAFFVDSGLTYDGEPATTIVGLDHLEGETVSILADGDYVGTKVVSSGQITLDKPASVVQVGLGYQSNLETLGIEVQTNSGTVITRPKLINTVWVSLYQTQGIQVGPNADRLKDVPDCAKKLFDGDARILMDGGWDQNGHIYIRQSRPLPMTVLAVTPQLDVGRR